MKQPSQLTAGNSHSSSRYLIYPSSDARLSGRSIIKWLYRSCERRCIELAYLSIVDGPGLPWRYGPYYMMSVVLLNKSLVRGLLSASHAHQISVIGGGENGYDKLQMRGSAKLTALSKAQIHITKHLDFFKIFLSWPRASLEVNMANPSLLDQISNACLWQGLVASCCHGNGVMPGFCIVPPVASSSSATVQIMVKLLLFA